MQSVRHVCASCERMNDHDTKQSTVLMLALLCCSLALVHGHAWTLCLLSPPYACINDTSQCPRPVMGLDYVFVGRGMWKQVNCCAASHKPRTHVRAEICPSVLIHCYSLTIYCTACDTSSWQSLPTTRLCPVNKQHVLLLYTVVETIQNIYGDL